MSARCNDPNCHLMREHTSAECGYGNNVDCGHGYAEGWRERARTAEVKLHEAAQEIETLKLAITPTHGTEWTTAQCATLAECHREDGECVDATDVGDSHGSIVDFDAVRLQRAARLATADAEIKILRTQRDDALTELTDTRRWWKAAKAEVEQLTKREAECHDVLAGLLALHDPDEDSDLHTRADHILGAHDPDGHCGNPICAALLKAEAEVETLQKERDYLQDVAREHVDVIFTLTARVAQLEADRAAY